jgi:hypothetical protein
LKNYGDLFIKHFQNKEIKFLIKSNSSSLNSNNNLFKDFRDGKFYKDYFLEKINNLPNSFLYQLYFDSTNLNKNKEKSIMNGYLCIMNDLLSNINIKFIYNISFITKINLKEIGIERYLEYIIKRFKNECEKIFYENNFFLWIFIFNNIIR